MRSADSRRRLLNSCHRDSLGSNSVFRQEKTIMREKRVYQTFLLLRKLSKSQRTQDCRFSGQILSFAEEKMFLLGKFNLNFLFYFSSDGWMEGLVVNSTKRRTRTIFEIITPILGNTKPSQVGQARSF